MTSAGVGVVSHEGLAVVLPDVDVGMLEESSTTSEGDESTCKADDDEDGIGLGREAATRGETSGEERLSEGVKEGMKSRS